MENLLQEVSNLATGYDSLVHLAAKYNSGEGTSGENNLNINPNPLFEGHSGIQVRTFRLDFDGDDPNEWILKANQFFTYCQTPRFTWKGRHHRGTVS